MIGSAGFVRIGRHRTKPVELWRNGAVRFVLNYSDAKFAAAYRLSHGTAICAIGLVVSDGPATMARARALGIGEHASDLPAMPALRGVGGSLVYILDAEAAHAIWEDEFAFDDAVEGADAVGVIAIDHLAATVHMDEFLSWQLYWRSLFDIHVQAPQDVIDPNGLVQSQAIQNRSGSFRITLNSTDARDALSTRFLTQSFGAGYQHIALLIRDLATAAVALDRLGLQRLPVPANYQDDVAPRLGLSETESAAARTYDMLVDEDGAGQRYRQIYSRAFAKTFFFEFVERGQYQGYGAPNAPIRLTAQNRYRDPASVD
jgi:4-hydroxyphenylpyruvate dioxygenase